MTSKQFIGDDFERAYARVFEGEIISGLRDCGRDISVPGFGFVQVKASLTGAREFLEKSLERKRFIPLCIGEPGTATAMLRSLRLWGGWVGSDVNSSRRQEILAGIARIRQMCSVS